MLYDYIVVGSGSAGLYFALNASKNHSVLVITKDEIKNSNTYYAQGGVAAVIDKNSDSYKLHMHDTIVAGSHINDKKVVKFHVKNAPTLIRELMEMGVEFTKTEEGELRLTKEGCHSVSRIAHADDITGQKIQEKLMELAQKTENITILDQCMAIDIIQKKRICRGVIALHKEKINTYLSKSVVLATGGLGNMYINNTNPAVSTGDGMAIAKRAGAMLRDMEFIQFHPSKLYHQKGQPFLISEALRGEGAVLVNENGEQFMKKYHKMGDLAPRDVVSRSITTEMKKTNSKFVYLDISHKDSDFVKKRFPNIYKECKKWKIDISKDKIPVVPAAHYMCGGIRIDKNGCTNIPGLYAIGETSCSRLNGANRLASNSIVEGLLFGKMALKHCNNYKKKLKLKEFEIELPKYKIDKNADVKKQTKKLQQLMWEKVGIVRNEKELWETLKEINSMHIDFDKKYYNVISRQTLELRNMLVNAREIIKSAIKRTKSIGCHHIVN